MIKFKLGALLTAVTGASAALTSLLVPISQSTSTYGIGFDNWNNWFMTGLAAENYVKGNNIKIEESTNTISAYQLDLLMNGIQKGYFNSMSEMLEIEGEYDEEAITATLTDLIIKDLIKQLELKESISGGSYFVPVSDANNYVFTSTEYASQLYQYYKGVNDSIKTSRLEALESLIESSGLVYEYNNNSYNSISDLVEVYLIDNNIGEKKVENHDYWAGDATFTDSKSSVHYHSSQNNSLGGTEEAQFRDIFWNEYNSKFTGMEKNNIEDYVYTLNDWYATSSYSDSRDKWIADNTVIIDDPSVINPAFEGQTLISLFGHPNNTNTLGDNLFSKEAWYNTDKDNGIGVNPNHEITDDNLGPLAFLAFMRRSGFHWKDDSFYTTKPIPEIWKNYENIGNSNKDGWINFITTMGLDNVPGKIKQEYNGTLRNWWEPDLSLPTNNEYGRFNSVFKYFGIKARENSSDPGVHWNWTTTQIEPLPDGRFVHDVLLGRNEVDKPSEAEFKNSNEHTIDFDQWWTSMPKKYIWNKKEFYDVTTLNDAIDKYIIDQYNPSIIEETYFDWSITDPNNVLNGLSNSLVMDGYTTEALAKQAIWKHIIDHGENNIWIENHSNLKFKENTGYDVDTSIIYPDMASISKAVNIISGESYTNDLANTNYSALKDYTEDKKILLNNYNNSGINLFFDTSDYESLASIILDNDLSAFNSNIKNLEISQLNVVDKLYTEKWYEFYLDIDVKDKSKTYLVKTDTFISGVESGPSDEDVAKIREKIRNYWLQLIIELDR